MTRDEMIAAVRGLSTWIRTHGNINRDDAIDECARAVMNLADSLALRAPAVTGESDVVTVTRGKLRAIEWGDTHIDEPCCPVCYRRQCDGARHAPECWLEAVLCAPPAAGAPPAEGSPLPLEHTRSCGDPYDPDARCTCGLAWRIRLATEQEMHAAWRKAAACLAGADALRRGTCGTCRHRVAADRNCQLLVMPVESGQTTRPGDASFSCALYAPTGPTR